MKRGTACVLGGTYGGQGHAECLGGSGAGRGAGSRSQTDHSMAGQTMAWPSHASPGSGPRPAPVWTAPVPAPAPIRLAPAPARARRNLVRPVRWYTGPTVTGRPARRRPARAGTLLVQNVDPATMRHLHGHGLDRRCSSGMIHDMVYGNAITKRNSDTQWGMGNARRHGRRHGRRPTVASGNSHVPAIHTSLRITSLTAHASADLVPHSTRPCASRDSQRSCILEAAGG